MIIVLFVCFAILCACGGALIAVILLRPRMRPSSAVLGPPPIFGDDVEAALSEQLEYEKNLAKSGVHYWTQQRERAVLQRIEKRTGKVTSPTIAAYVRHRLLQVEVVNLSPHKNRRR